MGGVRWYVLIEPGFCSHLFFISFTTVAHNTAVFTALWFEKTKQLCCNPTSLVPRNTRDQALSYFAAVWCCCEITRGKASGHRSRPVLLSLSLSLSYCPCLSLSLSICLLRSFFKSHSSGFDVCCTLQFTQWPRWKPYFSYSACLRLLSRSGASKRFRLKLVVLVKATNTIGHSSWACSLSRTVWAVERYLKSAVWGVNRLICFAWDKMDGKSHRLSVKKGPELYLGTRISPSNMLSVTQNILYQATIQHYPSNHYSQCLATWFMRKCKDLITSLTAFVLWRWDLRCRNCCIAKYKARSVWCNIHSTSLRKSTLWNINCTVLHYSIICIYRQLHIGKSRSY